MSSAIPRDDTGAATYDPVFLHSRREALVILGLWVAMLLWAVPYCYLNGYAGDVDPEQVRTVWGLPSWVFWGIVAPWIFADLFTIWFCFFYMVDDDLGEAHEGEDLREEIPERHAGESRGKGDQA